jgi:hypothetical protein
LDASLTKVLLHKVSAVLFLFGTVAPAAILQDKNPLIGTWNANIEKSKRHPNHLFKSAKLRFSITNTDITLSFTGGNFVGSRGDGRHRFSPRW